MYQVRVIVDHFMIGTTSYEKDSVMQVNQVVRDYLVKEKRVVDITDGDSGEGKGASQTNEATGYNRRDMQAGKTPPVVSTAPSPSKAQPKATPKKRGRGRPRKVKVDE